VQCTLHSFIKFDSDQTVILHQLRICSHDRPPQNWGNRDQMFSRVRANPDRHISGALDSRPCSALKRLDCVWTESKQAQYHHEAPHTLHVSK